MSPHADSSLVPRGGAEASLSWALNNAIEQRSHQNERAWRDSVLILKCCNLNRGLWAFQWLQHMVYIFAARLRLLHLATRVPASSWNGKYGHERVLEFQHKRLGAAY